MDNSIKFIENLNSQLLAHSFYPIKDVNSAVIPGIYVRMENPVLYILGVAPKEEQAVMEEILTQYTKQMGEELEEMRCTHVISLRILLSEEEGAAPIYTDERIHGVTWHFNLEQRQVFAKDGEPSRLFGIEKLLARAAQGEAGERPFLPMGKGSKPWACITIFALCVILLVYTTLSGQGGSVIRGFGLSREGILRGEYYRFITAMFLHSGLMHLASNSLFLYYFGTKAERLFGAGRFFILYLLSGLCGGVFSIFAHNVLGIGASGAIYGIMGAMLLLTKKFGPQYTGMSYATMLLLAVTSIGFGFLDMGVDNFAHIGGFLGGCVVFLCFLRQGRKEKDLST